MKHKQIKHTNWYEQYIDLINKGLSQRKACKEMDVPRSTIQHWLADRMVCDVTFEDHKEVIDEDKHSHESAKVVVNNTELKLCEHNNQRILLISDMHIPYHHKDTLSFLSYLKAKYRDWETDRKSTRLNSSHSRASRMPSSA